MPTSTSGRSGSQRRARAVVLAPVAAILAIAVVGAALRAHASSPTPDAAYATRIPHDALADLRDATGIALSPATTLAPAADEAEEAVDAAIGPLGIPNKDQVEAVELAKVTADSGDVLTGRTMWAVYGAGVAQRQFGPGGTDDSGKAVTEVGVSMAFVDPPTLRLIKTARY